MSISALLAGHPVPVVSDPRQTSVTLHGHLRRLIMAGVLPPGTVLKQTELAKLLAVSRTPMREAFRMLQEEGLIEMDVNQPARVSGFTPEELDALYAARITLECLGAHISTGRLNAEEIREGRRLLKSMRRAALADDVDAWSTLHRLFHSVLVVRSGAFVGRTIASYAAQCERYWRVYRSAHAGSLADRHHEHELLLECVLGKDPDKTGRLMAQHLSTTALAVLTDMDPGYAPTAVGRAVAMIGDSEPAAAPAR